MRSKTEKYTKSVSAVESILTLDKLRQSVAVKERLLAQGGSDGGYQTPSMRKTASVPNFSQVRADAVALPILWVTIMRFPLSESYVQLMRFDSFDFLSPVCNKLVSKSESVMDLNSDKSGESKAKKTKSDAETTPNKSFNPVGKLVERQDDTNNLRNIFSAFIYSSPVDVFAKRNQNIRFRGFNFLSVLS